MLEKMISSPQSILHLDEINNDLYMTGEPMLIQIFVNQYKYILAAWGMEMINLSVNIHVFQIYNY